MTKRCGRGRAALAGAAAVCVVAVLPGAAWAAGDGYRFADGSVPVQGAPGTGGAPELKDRQLYRSSLASGAKQYYAVRLDAREDAYVSVTAVPGDEGAAEDASDGFRTVLETADHVMCDGQQTAKFGSTGYARRLTAGAGRTLKPGSTTCAQAGTYYLRVERIGRGDPGAWDLEIRHVTEPGLTDPGAAGGPGSTPAAAPPSAGAPVAKAGGAGFADAAAVTAGSWTARVEPGRTLYYRVPVNWGQQLSVAADLGASAKDGGPVSGAVEVELFNPALGQVDQNSGPYDDKGTSLSLEPLPAVAYANRFASGETAAAVRFAGWYYVAVSLSPEVARSYGSLPLTLRVGVTGEATREPDYDGDPGPFRLAGGSGPLAGGSGASGSDGDARAATMRVVAVAGIGTGSVLLLGLGAWTVLARRPGRARGV
ncbi:hypothetical protein ABT160_08765 [Streptomyces sp. NPDC001941]|uniref:hypothetical protein n=1 Tax=Streptomyces sp. NPDC001941 TaxID=3154659 RepID=UPI003327E4EF